MAVTRTRRFVLFVITTAAAVVGVSLSSPAAAAPSTAPADAASDADVEAPGRPGGETAGGCYGALGTG